MRTVTRTDHRCTIFMFLERLTNTTPPAPHYPYAVDTTVPILFSQQTYKPRAVARSVESGAVANFHAAVFEIYTRFEYRHQKRHQRVKDEVRNLYVATKKE